jgi:DNA invertase Pin-like site-specific DNA recombinase
MKLAAQYLRMSTDKQRYSIASQAALISEYAAARGYEIVASYEDAARSGVTIRKRDGLKALLRDVMNGAPFSTILVVDVSRWGRYQDPDQAAYYEFMCREAGVQVRYCAEEFPDDDSPTAALIKSVKRVMAAEYSRQLSDRCRAALRRHMLAGGKGGGHPPYGFSRQIFNGDGSPGGILTVGERRSRYNQTVRLVQGPEEEVRAVKLIFKLFVTQMHGATKIAHHLNAKGIPYRREGPWTYDRVIYVVVSHELAHPPSRSLPNGRQRR